VLYFTVPNEDFPALVRQTTFKNLNSLVSMRLEVIDGLARLEPSGLGNAVLDSLGRTMEAWMNVYNMDVSDNTQPFFRISASTADTAQVQVIKEGHFVVSFIDEEPGSDTELNRLLPLIVDPTLVFDQDTELVNPTPFWSSSLSSLLSQPQTTTSRTPCSFVGTTIDIPPGGKVVLTSVYGHAETLDTFTSTIRDKVRRKGFAAEKRLAARAAVSKITEQVSTTTSFKLLDKYTEQSYLDNVLRGGLPLQLGLPTEPKIYHVYSRVHGDLERDYNNFVLDPTPYSQGPGNFRDVNQNRRVDTLINPFVGDFNVKMFLSFVQADGFNPGQVVRLALIFALTCSNHVDARHPHYCVFLPRDYPC
jgi:hypothetical protein